MIDLITDRDHLYRTFAQIQLRYWAGDPKRSRFPPGSDGETLPAFAQNLGDNLNTISNELRNGEYRFAPFIERKVIISGGREKRFSRASVRDTLVQKAITTIVEQALDPDLPSCLHSFRRRRPGGPGLLSALSRAAQASLDQKTWILQEDISSYFDHIQHGVLLETLAPLLPDDQAVLDLYTAYLGAPRQVGDRILNREVGLPIGSTMANFLANVYLLPLDMEMEKAGFSYMRYCDDLILFAKDEANARRAKRIVEDTVSARGLLLNPSKSVLGPPGTPFIYLGYEFDGPHMRIGQRAMRKFRSKVRRVTARRRWPRILPREISTPRGRSILAGLINEVNRLVTGSTFGAWPRYFSRADLDVQFRELDRWIQQRIRAALFHRWRDSDARHLSARQLRAQGLNSLVGEYWRWRLSWLDRQRSPLFQAASLTRLRWALKRTRARSWDPFHRRYSFLPGPDGLDLDDIAQDERGFLLRIQGQMLKGKYHFGAFVEYPLPKQGREDVRWIARPGLADSIVSRALASTLASHLDHQLPHNLHSYRPGRGTWSAIGELRRILLATESPWIVRADVAGFLDQIDLCQLDELLALMLPSEDDAGIALESILRSYLRSGRWRAEEGLLPRQQGLPRGGALTPLLGNLYLLPIDRALIAAGLRVVRYADDIIVIASSEDESISAWRIIQELASSLRLPLSEAKSGVIAPGLPFEFLGYRITGHRFDIRPYAINRLKRRVRRVTRRRRWSHLDLESLKSKEGLDELDKLIRQVNRLIVYGSDRNWAGEFARCTDDSEFRTLDHWIADRVRACVTGSWSLRNRRLVPDSLLRELGLVRLVPLYYHARRRIAGQAARAALARQTVPSPEAGQ
jgi:RNA-directed DNA polymerase